VAQTYLICLTHVDKHTAKRTHRVADIQPVCSSCRQNQLAMSIGYRNQRGEILILWEREACPVEPFIVDLLLQVTL